jgi:hypothetical protein
MTGEPLGVFTVPITSGTRPAPAGAGRLSEARQAALGQQLDALAAARAAAAFQARTYPIRTGGRHGR